MEFSIQVRWSISWESMGNNLDELMNFDGHGDPQRVVWLLGNCVINFCLRA